LIILLCKKGEAKRLSSLVLKVCNNDMNVYIDGESIIKQNQSIHDKDDDFKKIEDER